jgi:hypothetical protein
VPWSHRDEITCTVCCTVLTPSPARHGERQSKARRERLRGSFLFYFLLLLLLLLFFFPFPFLFLFFCVSRRRIDQENKERRESFVIRVHLLLVLSKNIHTHSRTWKCLVLREIPNRFSTLSAIPCTHKEHSFVKWRWW